MLIHLKEKLAGRILRQSSVVNALRSSIVEVARPEALEGPSLKTRISIDWKRFLLIALCASQLSFGMENGERNELWYLATIGELEQVKQLLATGVDPDQLTSSGCLPLYGAVMYGHLGVCRALIDAGADVNFRMKNTLSTPLMAISPVTSAELCKLLLSAGAEVNVVDWCGISPLMRTCMSSSGRNTGNLEACELFLQYGADLEQRNDRDMRAIDYAREYLLNCPWSAEKLGKIVALLEDPEKIHAVIMRADNPNLKKLRKNGTNICTALMNRELGLK